MGDNMTLDQLAEQAAADGHKDERESQTTLLVRFVQERCELFHDDNRNGYATRHDTGETRRLESLAFRDWMAAEFFATHNKAPREPSIKEAVSTLSGIARHRGEQRAVFLRCADYQESYYLDMAIPGSSRAIHLYAGGWRVEEQAPVRFFRTESMLALPHPVADGDITALWDLANIPVESRVLVITWLIDALRTNTPYPVLELIGEAGTAKSSTQQALKQLIDPNACDLRSPPAKSEDAYITAGMNHLVSYENVSHLPAPLQDAMCVLATGGGYARRKLYSDADESVIQVKRPIILNGISANVTAQDLADRTISIELPRLDARVEMDKLMKAYQEAKPAILGGLLDLAAKALACLPNVSIPPHQRPRILEYYKLGVALERVSGLPFSERFHETRIDAVSRTIDASPVAAALLAWFEGIGSRDISMSAKELLEAVSRHRPDGNEAWPKSPKGFADALRRAAPALRQLGVDVHSQGKVGGSIRWRVAIHKNLSVPCPECPDDLPEPADKESISPNSCPESPDVLASTPHHQDTRTCRTLDHKVSSSVNGEDEAWI